MNLRRRIYRHLELEAARGAFDYPSGALFGLDADDIADGIAAEWDGRNRGRLIMVPGDSAPTAADLERYVSNWLTARAA